MNIEEEKFHIEGSCNLVVTKWQGIAPDVTLDYIEHSPDSWYSNTETSCDIDKEKAIGIIQFLMKSLNITDDDIKGK